MSLFSSIANWAGNNLGTIANVGGTLLGYQAAQDAAKQNAQAMNNLGAQAAAASQFKPYSVTTGLGTSFFDTTKNTAGYTLNPVLQAFRDRAYGTSAGVFDQLGQADPQQMAAQYLAEQQGLLSPTRQAEDIALRNQQLQRGRIGLGIASEAAGAGAGGMVNPEQFQLQRARAMADAQMAAGARQQAQADIDRLIGRGQGLFNFGTGIEQLGMAPLELGSTLGGRAADAGSRQASALLSAGQQAAQANLAAGLGSAQMYNTLGTALGGMFAPRSGSSGFGGGGLMDDLKSYGVF